MNRTPKSAPAMAEDGPALRAAVIATALAMNGAGININKSGNVSARCSRGSMQGFVVTPTAVPYRVLGPEDLVYISVAGKASGAQAPSSEWRFHRDIYAARAEFGAIVHTHSAHATALACHGRGLPAFHYMVAVAGGDVRCAPYATFGTQALSDHAVQALADRRACLLAHHGVIACGADLDEALALAIEVEHLAQMYLAACALGEPPRLNAKEMSRVLERFESYGTRAARHR